jgi:vacuolar-type H+-ATPase subunit I/STV1
MTTSEQSQLRTRLFARTLGPFFAIVPTTVAVRGSYMQTLFTEFKANPMWPWLFGAILLMFGLVIIAYHQYWRSPAAIIVSVVGWIMAIRGVLLLTVPQAYSAAGNAVYSSGASAGIWVVGICLGLAGLYLTYVGWKPEPRTPQAVVSTTEDHPHAAGD